MGPQSKTCLELFVETMKPQLSNLQTILKSLKHQVSAVCTRMTALSQSNGNDDGGGANVDGVLVTAMEQERVELMTWIEQLEKVDIDLQLILDEQILQQERNSSCHRTVASSKGIVKSLQPHVASIHAVLESLELEQDEAAASSSESNDKDKNVLIALVNQLRDFEVDLKVVLEEQVQEIEREKEEKQQKPKIIEQQQEEAQQQADPYAHCPFWMRAILRH